VPSGVTWTLPVYELALLAAARVELSGSATEIVLVSAEHRPLELFGANASLVVADFLVECGVRFVRDSPATRWSDGQLAIQGDAPIDAERVITVPQLRVNRIPGVTASWWGFVPTDSYGRVEGLSDVYAAGDMTTYPIKQGGLATQQADAAAAHIAARTGAQIHPGPFEPVLRAELLAPGGSHFMRLGVTRGTGNGSDTEIATEPLWWPPAKIAGRYLGPYLARVVAD
jgi:sulfide:quinone oxidoreductase